MDNIKVGLPKPNDTSGGEIKGFLRQLELCVHHLKKSVDELEKDGLLKDYYLIYHFPRINLYGREQDNNGYVKIHVDEESDQMQEIEIEITKL